MDRTGATGRDLGERDTTARKGRLVHPNLVLVFPDQMRGSALGFLGEEPVTTPRLDAFAAGSVVFTQAVSNFPVSSPYRASLMTGRYPHANGVTGNCNSMTTPHGCELRTDARCWSDVLKGRGYSLGYIGKWHLDSPRRPHVDCANNRGRVAWNEWCPPERRHGFDFWYSYGTYDRHLRPMYWTGDAPRDGFRYVDQWGPEHEADLAIRYIRNDGGDFRDPARPFALVVSMNPPHMPYSAVPREYVERYADRTLDDLCAKPSVRPAGTRWGDYYRRHIRNQCAMIAGVDEQFGRILDALDAEGLAEETIVVFTSDHGDCLGAHGRQSKPSWYEEAFRIPLIVRWPGRLKPRRDELLVSAPDVYPTLLDLMGFADDVPGEVQGASLARAFPDSPSRDGGEGSGRPTSQLYLAPRFDAPAEGTRGVRTERYTLVYDRPRKGDARTLLFDRREDPHELTNVAASRPEVVERLTAELRAWLERTGDPWKWPPG